MGEDDVEFSGQPALAGAERDKGEVLALVRGGHPLESRVRSVGHPSGQSCLGEQARQADARSTSSVPKTVHRGPRSAPLTREASSPIIRAPISSMGWWIVVSCGVV